MPKWQALYINDPNQDYDLTLEIQLDDVDVGWIRRGEDGLELVWYAHPQHIKVPVTWLRELLQEAEETLK